MANTPLPILQDCQIDEDHLVIRIVVAGFKTLPELSDNWVRESLLERAANHIQQSRAERVVPGTSTDFQNTEVGTAKNKSFWIMATATVTPLP